MGCTCDLNSRLGFTMFSDVEKKHMLTLLGLVVSSLLLKLLYILSANSLNNDGVLYIQSAVKIAEGDLIGAVQIYPMPLYPFLICVFNYMFNDWIFSGQFINVLALALANIPLYFLARKLFDDRVALWTVVLFTLSPKLTNYASNVIRDPLFLLFFTWALLMGVKAVQCHRIKDYLWCGALTMVAFFCRIEAVLLPVVLFVYLVLLFIMIPEERKKIFKGGLAFYALPLVGVALLGALAFTSFESLGRIDFVLNYVKNFLSLGFLNNYHILYDFLKNLENNWDGYLGAQNLFELTRHHMPLIYLIGAIENFVEAMFPAYFILLCVGFYQSPKFGREHYFVFLTGLVFFLMAYFRLLEANFIVGRLFLVSTLAAFPWVAYGLNHLFNIDYRSKNMRRVSCVFLLVFAIGIPVGKTLANISKHDELKKNTGDWLAQQEDFNDLRIVTNDPTIMLYSGRIFADEYKMVKTNYFGIEVVGKVILEVEPDVVVITISEKSDAPNYSDYSIVKRFDGRKKSVFVYRKK